MNIKPSVKFALYFLPKLYKKYPLCGFCDISLFVIMIALFIKYPIASLLLVIFFITQKTNQFVAGGKIKSLVEDNIDEFEQYLEKEKEDAKPEYPNEMVQGNCTVRFHEDDA